MALVVVVIGVCAQVPAYHVDPVNARWSAWAGHEDTVSQTVICNFDSLSYVELFVEASGHGDAYRAGVWLNDREVMWSIGTQVRNESWVKFQNWNTQVAFTKGKTLTIRFTRGGSDSLEYYWNGGDPYPYGAMLVPDGPTPDGGDLACRVLGRMDTVADNFCGAKASMLSEWDVAWCNTWLARAREAGLKLIPMEFNWPQIETAPGCFDFAGPDRRRAWFCDSAGAEVVGTLVGCPDWVSSRINNEAARDSVGRDTSHYCPPRGLWASGDDNYWAKFVDTIVKRYGNSVHTWECWNEGNLNDTTVIEPDECNDGNWGSGWWRYPNIDTGYHVRNARGLCSLYVRLCWVTDSVVRAVSGHESDRVLVGALHQVSDFDTAHNFVAGKEWLRTCYEITTAPGGPGAFWDGVSVHPYVHWWWGREFYPDTFEADAETLHAIMEAADRPAELWNTEMGWASSGDTLSPANEQAARNLNQMCVRSLASQALPGGGYDRACWWIFNDLGSFGYYSMLNAADFHRNPAFYSFEQTTAQLTSRWFNRSVVHGGNAVDNHTRIYEFEDTTEMRKRTWVCWRDGDVKQSIEVKLPVRTNRLSAESLA